MAFCRFSSVYLATDLAKTSGRAEARIRIRDTIEIWVGAPLLLRRAGPETTPEILSFLMGSGLQ